MPRTRGGGSGSGASFSAPQGPASVASSRPPTRPRGRGTSSRFAPSPGIGGTRPNRPSSILGKTSCTTPSPACFALGIRLRFWIKQEPFSRRRGPVHSNYWSRSPSQNKTLRTLMPSGPAWSQKLRDEIGKAVVGQDAAVERLLVALLAGRHVLLAGMTCFAKTLLVKSLASALGIQF